MRLEGSRGVRGRFNAGLRGGSRVSEERALPLRVYVPREGTAARAAIAEHSGAVGTPIGGGRVVLDFEANMYGAANIKTYADAVHHAAGRHLWGPRVTPRAPGPRRTRMRLSMSASTTANGWRCTRNNAGPLRSGSAWARSVSKRNASERSSGRRSRRSGSMRSKRGGHGVELRGHAGRIRSPCTMRDREVARARPHGAGARLATGVRSCLERAWR